MSSNVTDIESESFEYIGFWLRFGASIIDSILLLMITFPLLYLIYGGLYSDELVQGPLDVIISYVFPVVATILFWLYKSATPGKMALSVKIVDAKTGNLPTVSQSIIRYIGYYVSLLPLGLGFLWIGWDAIIPFMILVFWILINPTLFSKPKDYNSWAAKAVLGERIFINRKENPLPNGHLKAIIILNILQSVSVIVLIFGLWNLNLSFTIHGIAYVYLTKMWFLDRMVWLYQSTNSV